MFARHIVAALAATAIIAVSVSADAADGNTRVYAIATQNASTELGTVTLTAMGEKTRVVVALANAPTDVPQPMHIHPGSCAKLDPKPQFPLTTAIDGTSTTVVDAPLAKLVGGGFAVNVHKSTTDIAKYVACGDLGVAK